MSIFLLSMVLSFVACTLIAQWYVMPAIRQRPMERALPPLLLFQCFRYFGLAFLVPGVVSPDLPLGFARPAGYGDLVSSLLAFLALLAVHFRWRTAIPVIWLFNVVGFLDLINAFVQAVMHHVNPGQLGVMYFVRADVAGAISVRRPYHDLFPVGPARQGVAASHTGNLTSQPRMNLQLAKGNNVALGILLS